MINPGDHVISNRYGPGRVTSKASVDGCVDVSYPDGPYDCIYNAFNGKRYLTIGHDIIRLEGSNDRKSTESP